MPQTPAPGRRPRRRCRLIAPTIVLALVGGVIATVPAERVDAATLYYSGAGDVERISVIGDSVMSGMRWYGTLSPLRRYNYTVDLESCRRTVIASCRGREGYAPDNTINAMRRLRGQLGQVLVVGTGYNDPRSTFPGAVDTVMAEAAAQGIPVVVWVTMREATTYTSPGAISNATTFRANNQTLREKTAQYGGRLRVADWSAYSAARWDWVARDGAHLTYTGGFAMASFIANQAALALRDLRRPTALRAAVAPVGGIGSNQVLLTWGPPHYSRLPITDWAIQHSGDGGASWRTIVDGVSTRRSLVVSGLSTDRPQLFRVASYSGRSGSTYSIPVSARPRVVIAGPPIDLGVTVAPDAGLLSHQVRLAWDAHPYTGARPIVDYRIQMSTDGGATWRLHYDGVSSRRSVLLSNLSTAHVYLLRVATVTTAGTSRYSRTIGVRPRIAVPSPPPQLTASVDPDDGGGPDRVVLSWTAPTYTGGHPIRDYALRYSIDGGLTWRSVPDGPSTTSPFLFTGLTPGQAYAFRVAAITAIGAGALSTVVTVRTPDAPPPTTTSTTTASPAAATVSPALAPSTTPPPTTTSTTTTSISTTTTSPPTVAPEPVTLGDVVWLDTDGDGQRGPGDESAVGLGVRLRDAGGAIVGEVVTDAAGAYRFTVTTAGRYVVEVVMPDGVGVSRVELDGTVAPATIVDTVEGPVARIELAIGAGPGAVDLDIGLLPPPPPPSTVAETVVVATTTAATVAVDTTTTATVAVDTTAPTPTGS